MAYDFMYLNLVPSHTYPARAFSPAWFLAQSTLPNPSPWPSCWSLTQDNLISFLQAVETSSPSCIRGFIMPFSPRFRYFISRGPRCSSFLGWGGEAESGMKESREARGEGRGRVKTKQKEEFFPWMISDCDVFSCFSSRLLAQCKRTPFLLSCPMTHPVT